MTPLTESQQDALILSIYEAARAQSGSPGRIRRREDLIHDFILECLVHIRAGRFPTEIRDMHAFVKTCLGFRRIDRWRSRIAQMERDAQYEAEVLHAPREWMDQDLKIEEDRLRFFARQVFASIDPKSVDVHHMVRDEGRSYWEVADIIGRSVAMAHKHVSTVQRAFRQALPAIGIKPPISSRGGRLKRPVQGAARRARVRTVRLPGRKGEVVSLSRLPSPHVTRELWSFAPQPAFAPVPAGSALQRLTSSR